MGIRMESTLPAAVGKHHNRILTNGLFIRSKIAAHYGLNPERSQPVRGYDTPCKSLRDRSICVVEIVLPSGRRDLLKRLGLFTNDLVLGRSRRVLVPIRFDRRNMNQAFRFPKRQGA